MLSVIIHVFLLARNISCPISWILVQRTAVLSYYKRFIQISTQKMIYMFFKAFEGRKFTLFVDSNDNSEVHFHQQQNREKVKLTWKPSETLYTPIASMLIVKSSGSVSNHLTKENYFNFLPTTIIAFSSHL